MSIRELLDKWASRRAEHSRLGSLVNADAIIGDVIADLEALDRDRSGDVGTLTEAAAYSGLHPDSIGRRIKKGKLKNHGSARRPLVRFADLPKRADAPPVAVMPSKRQDSASAASAIFDTLTARTRRA